MRINLFRSGAYARRRSVGFLAVVVAPSTRSPGHFARRGRARAARAAVGGKRFGSESPAGLDPFLLQVLAS